MTCVSILSIVIPVCRRCDTTPSFSHCRLCFSLAERTASFSMLASMVPTSMYTLGI